VPRAALALLVVLTLALASVAAAGVESGPGSVGGPDASILLRGRQGIQGPWRRYLWLRLNRHSVISFTVCAVRNRTKPTPSCAPPQGERLPQGSILKLEQRRAGRGWRTVAISRGPALQAVLSNGVTGNRLGTISYRVTLRNEGGRAVETSNTFKVYWTK
jgi:hypothetical protein